MAFRVHRMAEMVAFYSEAFGARFRPVDTYGIRSQFGELPGITLKFVPIRDAVEFRQFPIHQPGFEVPDIAPVVAAALRHGGRVQNEAKRENGWIVAAIRDPDGLGASSRRLRDSRAPAELRGRAGRAGQAGTT